jgi:hypothetical protein
MLGGSEQHEHVERLLDVDEAMLLARGNEEHGAGDGGSVAVGSAQGRPAGADDIDFVFGVRLLKVFAAGGKQVPADAERRYPEQLFVARRRLVGLLYDERSHP